MLCDCVSLVMVVALFKWENLSHCLEMAPKQVWQGEPGVLFFLPCLKFPENLFSQSAFEHWGPTTLF